jgi:hypothetical protein
MVPSGEGIAALAAGLPTTAIVDSATARVADFLVVWNFTGCLRGKGESGRAATAASISQVKSRETLGGVERHHRGLGISAKIGLDHV